MKWVKKSIPFLVALLFLSGVLYGLSTTQKSTSEQDIERARNAIQRAVLTCYSIEGEYPEDIDYLKEHYGLYVDEEKYFIHYEYIGSNIMPEHGVFIKEAAYEE